MIATKITTTAQNCDIIKDILSLTEQAYLKLISREYEDFIGIAGTMQLCAHHTYSELQTAIKDNISDVCWELSELDFIDVGHKDNLIDKKSTEWKNKITDLCNSFII